MGEGWLSVLSTSFGWYTSRIRKQVVEGGRNKAHGFHRENEMRGEREDKKSNLTPILESDTPVAEASKSE